MAKNPLDRYIRDWVEKSDVESFYSWAFGDEYYMKNGLELRTAWNDLHGSTMNIPIDRYLSDELPILVELWRDANE